MSGYGNYMEESNIEWYIEKAKELTEYINEMNKVADQVMKDNPDMVICKLSNDPKHWAEYGIHTVTELENYLDAEAAQC